MASLSSGVLMRLLEEMGVEDDEKASSDDREPALLQIRCIIPVLAEGNLWPNQGFYLKVSDSSHAVYVSLPHDQDEMILSNKLQLGQYVYVQRLEAAYPVPILRGITPIPGRHPCLGTPEDLVAATNLKIDHETSDSASMLVGEKKTRENFRSSSASKARPNEQIGRTATLNSLSEKCDSGRKSPDILKEIQKISSSLVDKRDGVLKPSSSSTVMRRSWNGMEITRIKEISDSSVVKHENKPVSRPRSACGSPIHSARCDSSDANPSSMTRRKSIGLATKSVKNHNMTSRISVSGKICETLKPAVMCSSINEGKWTETKIPWDSLPSTLVKLGKEVLRHRDVAMLAAVEALQEASAAEKLIRCLSTYSEFQSGKWDDDLQPSVDKFLDLQDDLAHTRLIVQSLTNISPLRTTNANSKSTGSIKEVLEIAFERKKHATSWIKAAVTSDLSPFAAPSDHINASVETTNTVKKSSRVTNGRQPKGTCIVRKQRKNGEIQVGLAAENDNQLQDWVKGSALCAAADLEKSLEDECRRWFLGYVEKYLDGVKGKTISMESDSKIAGMMCQFKRVNDWLDMIASKEANSPQNECKDSSKLEDSEIEACGRVKNKIYGVLLNHVERTALALKNMNATAQG